MIGWLAIELLYIFSQVCLHALYALLFEKVVELYLLCHHALALDHCFAVLLYANLLYLFQRLLAVFRPYHFSAAFGKSRFECFEMSIEGLDCTPFKVFG